MSVDASSTTPRHVMESGLGSRGCGTRGSRTTVTTTARSPGRHEHADAPRARSAHDVFEEGWTSGYVPRGGARCVVRRDTQNQKALFDDRDSRSNFGRARGPVSNYVKLSNSGSSNFGRGRGPPPCVKFRWAGGPWGCVKFSAADAAK